MVWAQFVAWEVAVTASEGYCSISVLHLPGLWIGMGSGLAVKWGSSLGGDGENECAGTSQ